MKMAKIIGTAMLATILLAGCCNCGKISSYAFEDTVWQLEQLNGRAVKTQDDNFTVAFLNTGRASGKGVCNTFFGPWEYSGEQGGNNIAAGPMASTMKA